ncbi:MAG TPA: chromosomal replication initiator protein DnaA [Candidatus Coatesbacteria bacterium]|nr:chromosomal replication initiator protein DnaA [Candidatus Coatesbacteria bacterium]
MNRLKELWAQVSGNLKPQIDPYHYKSYISLIRPKSITDSQVTLEVPNQRYVDWLGSTYLELLSGEFSTLSGHPLKVVLVARNNGGGEPPAARTSPYNPKYTFESFVVGRGNSTAYAAAQAVAERPGQIYNPLFIYAGVGLGKTHILHAIGQESFNSRRELRTAYVTSEEFTNEFIEAIRYDRSSDLRTKYRNLDILLIDDLQFLAGKEATLEELFHTFNTLYNNSKQIVFTSDRPPAEIKLDERLVTRFEWGLVIDIQPPDIETRIAIIKAKAENDGIHLPEEVVDLIAQRVRTNIRTIEGAILRLSAFSAISEQPISAKMAREVLSNILGREAPRVSIGAIQRVVCDHFEVALGELLSKTRNAAVVFPRQVAMYLARNLTDAKLHEIGLQFGGRDHSTVIHSYNKIRDAVEKDPDTAALVSKLERIATAGGE